MTADNREEKRRYPRHEFISGRCPRFQAGGFSFQVLDCSRNGLRILNPDGIHLDGWISGVLVTKEHGEVAVDAIVVRRRDGEIGLHLVVPLAAETLERELKDSGGLPSG
jgi:hypothetical protein